MKFKVICFVEKDNPNLTARRVGMLLRIEKKNMNTLSDWEITLYRLNQSEAGSQQTTYLFSRAYGWPRQMYMNSVAACVFPRERTHFPALSTRYRLLLIFPAPKK